MNLQKVIDTKLNKENLEKLGFNADTIEKAKLVRSSIYEIFRRRWFKIFK